MRYPIPTFAAAKARIDALERLIQSVDQRLKTTHPAGVPDLEAERARLEDEHAPLYAAYELLTSMHDRPRCPCGKVAHPDRASAEEHLAAQRIIDNRRGRYTVHVYFCEWGPAVWHVGHGARIASGASLPDLGG